MKREDSTLTTDADAEGPYRIHVVAELTSVPEPTLRAWERRYGIPTPERTAAGYRLYGAREVEQVRKMKALCEGGLSAREAAARVRGAGAGAGSGTGAGTGADRLRLASSTSEPDDQKSLWKSAQEDPFSSARAALIKAISHFDIDGLEHGLRQISFLADATTLLDHVLSPVLVEIGEKWHAGEISVAEEHLASQRIGAFVRDLVQLAPGASSHRRVVMASFADDDHEIGLLGLALRLSTWDLRPVFLGARTPPSAVRTAVQSTGATLVALSVTSPLDRPRARELVSGYADACGSVPWLVGGVGAERLRDLVTEAGGLIDPKDPVALRALIDGALRKRHRTKGKNDDA